MNIETSHQSTDTTNEPNGIPSVTYEPLAIEKTFMTPEENIKFQNIFGSVYGNKFVNSYDGQIIK